MTSMVPPDDLIAQWWKEATKELMDSPMVDGAHANGKPLLPQIIARRACEWQIQELAKGVPGISDAVFSAGFAIGKAQGMAEQRKRDAAICETIDCHDGCWGSSNCADAIRKGSGK